MTDNAVEKERAIIDWLKNVFDEEAGPVPKFSRSGDSIEHLYGLMVKHQSLERSIKVYREFCATSKEHFSLATEDSCKLLDQFGLNGDLSEYLTVESECLSKLSDTLSLSNADSSSFILALSELSLKKERTISGFELHKRRVDSRERELTQTVSNVQKLENMADKEMQKEAGCLKTLTSLESEAAFLNQKVFKYKSDKNKYDRALNSSLLRTDLTHDKLVEDHDELKAIQAKLDLTREQLDMYASLPPDKRLAEVKLAAAKAELQELEDRLVKKCDLFHL